MGEPSKDAKPDELALWAALDGDVAPRDAGRALGMHPKRVLAICEKWARKGIYDYGVSADLGWKNP